VVSLVVNISIFLLSIVALFQLALAFGMPWGSLAMGGKYPGKFPVPMRLAAVVQAFVLIGIGFVLLIKSKVMFPSLYQTSEIVIWGIVVFNVLGLIMNLATPSKWERIIWAPVAGGLLVCSILVAFS